MRSQGISNREEKKMKKLIIFLQILVGTAFLIVSSNGAAQQAPQDVDSCLPQ